MLEPAQSTYLDNFPDLEELAQRMQRSLKNQLVGLVEDEITGDAAIKVRVGGTYVINERLFEVTGTINLAAKPAKLTK